MVLLINLAFVFTESRYKLPAVQLVSRDVGCHDLPPQLGLKSCGDGAGDLKWKLSKPNSFIACMLNLCNAVIIYHDNTIISIMFCEHLVLIQNSTYNLII